MLMFAARHHIAAKTEVFSFADINSAVQRVRNNAARYRVVLEA
jgi:D-arabinose 1-dehydrogenase-like Zn-dependent alcohol dehydrogenase